MSLMVSHITHFNTRSHTVAWWLRCYSSSNVLLMLESLLIIPYMAPGQTEENRPDLYGGSQFDCKLASQDKAFCSLASPGARALHPDLLPWVPEPGSRWKAMAACLTPWIHQWPSLSRGQWLVQVTCLRSRPSNTFLFTHFSRSFFDEDLMLNIIYVCQRFPISNLSLATKAIKCFAIIK